MQIINNNYSILEILQMLDRRELVVNADYQRGSGLWPEAPSSYFIDTILEKYPFPKIYMYEFLDKSNRGMKKEIVDGQQRVGTIKRYYSNEFAIRGEGRFAGQRFRDLDEESQSEFLSYSVSVDVIRNAKRAEILQMFRRMNAFTLPLNEAEKRHSSYQGLFKWFINNMTDELNEFFVEFGVFTDRQIVRMADAAFISDCILSYERGIISTGPSDLTSLYKNYDSEFRYGNDYHHKLAETFDFISSSFGVLRKTFMMKPYALHSLITALMFNRFGNDNISQEMGIVPSGRFCLNVSQSQERLFSLAQAHEAKETDGPYGDYVWGCLSTVDRRPRRSARVLAILRAIGLNPPHPAAYVVRA